MSLIKSKTIPSVAMSRHGQGKAKTTIGLMSGTWQWPSQARITYMTRARPWDLPDWLSRECTKLTKRGLRML